MIEHVIARHDTLHQVLVTKKEESSFNFRIRDYLSAVRYDLRFALISLYFHFKKTVEYFEYFSQFYKQYSSASKQATNESIFIHDFYKRCFNTQNVDSFNRFLSEVQKTRTLIDIQD